MTATRLHITQGSVVIDDGAPFALELGGSLQPATLRYAIYGELNDAADNVVLVCHALSGSAEVHEWWPELLYGLFDLERDCVICFNIFGSCYGSTGPRSIDARTGERYGKDFPLVTVGDTVRAEAAALKQLGVRRVKAAIGGSIGGMQALQLAIDFPELVERAIVIGVAPLQAMGLALNHLQRTAIALDPEWNDGGVAANGISLARQIAMCSYKSAHLYDERHGRTANRKGPSPFKAKDGRFDVAGFLDHQGEKFVARFDPHAYIAITKAMDLWDPARESGGDGSVYAPIRAEVTLVGISSDWLFPPDGVKRLAAAIQSAGVRCHYRELVSDHGHDAFLADCDKLAPIVKAAMDASGFLKSTSSGDLHAGNTGTNCSNRASEHSA